MPGEMLIDTTPHKGYWSTLQKRFKKKFIVIEVSVPHNLKQGDREAFTKSCAEIIGFSNLPYKASFQIKGDSHSIFFYLCEYVYHKQAIDVVVKRIHINKKGQYCSKDDLDARELVVKGKSNISKKHNIFKSNKACFLTQIKRIKQAIYEMAQKIKASYEYGAITKKFRFKKPGKLSLRKVKVLNDALKNVDIWLNDLNNIATELERDSSPIGDALSKIYLMVQNQKFKLGKFTIKLYSPSENKESFLYHCGLLINQCREKLFPEDNKAKIY